jgi:hypothetical protein
MQITEAEFFDKINTYAGALENDQELSVQEYILIGFLWNTLTYNEPLMQSISGKRFHTVVWGKGIPRMIDKLNMETGRGYSFHSKEFDFTLGGTMEPRYRFEII